jgi:WD40 repeat protein
MRTARVPPRPLRLHRILHRLIAPALLAPSLTRSLRRRDASPARTRSVRLWDVEKGKHVLTLPGHADDVKSVAFSDGSNGKYQLVTGDATGVVRLWDIGKIGQREELSTLRGHRGAVTTVSFHPSAPIIASSSVDKSIIIWDIGSTRLLKRLDDQGNDISAVAFSPDGHHVASVNKTGTVKVWNIDSGEFVSFGDGAVDDKMRHVAFSHDGSLLVAGSEEGKIKVWSAKAGEILGSFTAHTAKIQGLDFSPDGTLLASSSEDASVKLWRVADWSLRSTLNGHHSGVYQIAFSLDGRFLVTGSDDKTVRLWNLSGKELLKPILHASPVWAVDFSPDGKMIATGSQDSALQLWDVTVSGDTAKLKNHVVLRITDGPIWWMKFKRVQDKMILGVGSQDKTVRIFSMTAFKTLFSSPQKLESEGEQQGGLMVGEGPTGEREIIPLSNDRFTPKEMENLRAAVHSRS